MAKRKHRRRTAKSIATALLVVIALAVGYGAGSITGNTSNAESGTSNVAAATTETSYGRDGEASSDDCETCTLERVVDGDTLVVNIDGESYKVRLIGVDTPESVHPDSDKNTEEGQTASDYTKSLLTEGQTLYLARDTSDTDKYDRLLRYVWIEEPSDQPTDDEVATSMLNGILVANGYAQAKEYDPDTAFADVFERLAEQAAEEGLGLSATFTD